MRALKVWFPVIVGGSGTDVWTCRLADALRRRGVDTEITWFPAHYQFCPFLLRRAPAPSGTTVAHANSWNGFAFKRAGIPLVVTEHLNVLDTLYDLYKDLPQRAYHTTFIRRFVIASFKAASAITAVSRFTASGLARILGINNAQVIHNWINTEVFYPPIEDPGPPTRPFRLLFVGNLSRRKGADLLFPIMKELEPGFELYFTSGLGREKRIEVTPNMVPLGPLRGDQELLKAYHRCDVLLFPSRFEGLPLVPLEAMACGKPVIATNISSLPEIVGNGVTGILCPPDNTDVFVKACRTLAGNPEIVRKYGEAARRHVKELFSEENIIPQYISLYEKLAHGIDPQK